MDFVLINVGQELIEQMVSAIKFHDIVGSQQCWQTSLPEVVTPFDFTLGLWGGRIAQSHPIKVQSFAQLGESFRDIGEE